MAWADPLPGGGYRDSAKKKQYVKDANGKTRKFARKKDARDAATGERRGRPRSRLLRCMQPDAGSLRARQKAGWTCSRSPT